MRLQFLAPLPPPVHGVTQVTLQAWTHLRDRPGLAVLAVDIGQSGNLTDLGRNRLRKALQLIRSAARLLVARCRRGPADLSYTTLSPFGSARFRDGAIILLGRLTAQRCLVHLHAEGLEAILSGRAAGDRLLRICLRGTELLTSASHSARRARGSGRFARIWPVPNPAPDPGPPPDRSPGPLRILHLANLIPGKGVQEVIAALAQLAAAGIPFEAKLVGAPTAALTLDRVRGAVRQAGLEQTVAVTGPLYGADKERAIGWADILAYPSRHDHTPLVVIEAMAAGTVPIVYATGAVADLLGPALQDNVIAAGSPPDTISRQLAARIAFYAAAPDRLRTDRLAARQRYCTNYTPGHFHAALDRAVNGPRLPDTAPVPSFDRSKIAGR
ncbi:glycosyltransferase [Oleisolibacter albus]|uniref:glycosyltransferase n=1 Tax=Oleisolibacter albus TaxID=2171757 RepID=UPI000DF1D265|nr:glycosyltransferase [Oleisolibacter albus]